MRPMRSSCFHPIYLHLHFLLLSLLSPYNKVAMRLWRFGGDCDLCVLFPVGGAGVGVILYKSDG
ncbi:Protein of unknown function [Pyronema omphalodes CBS 100304]|uniref:Uncharacterized protein n=1 Tax=Pyronema omphalodes (strain CBS 100304) TaxID=1076935 RepID=U4LKK2_PYROM|nr:Protein of unknown function [Pyronema omphalodes CBS 100304]